MKRLFRPVNVIIFMVVSFCGFGWLFSADAASNVVAKVDRENITVQDFMNEWQAQDRPDLSSATSGALNEEKNRVLNQLVDRRLLFNQANKEKFNVDEQLVDQILALEKVKYKSDSEFMNLLREKKFTLKEYRAYLADDLRIRQLLIKYVYSRVTVIDSEVEQYYSLNSTQYATPEKIKLRIIYIKVPSTATAEEKGEKLAKAKLAEMKLKLGSAFEDIAKTMSDSENAIRGGDAGYVTWETFKKAPELAKIAFSLDIGEYSDVVETQYGFYILKVEGRVEARGKRFWEVRDQIRNDLNRERITNQYNRFIADLRNQYQIELFPENLP